MKIIYSHLLLLFVLVSCNNAPKNESEKDSKAKETAIYQMEIYERAPEDFKVIYLNKLNGIIYVRDNNGSWYNAQALTNLKVYKTPAYSMRVFNGPDKQFQIALSNDITGSVYIRSYANSWYDASRVAVVE